MRQAGGVQFMPEARQQAFAQQEQVPYHLQATEAVRVPTMREMKLNMSRFDGKELYPGLGSNFKSWGLKFQQQVELAQHASRTTWSEAIKICVLGNYLEGEPERLFDDQKDAWSSVCPELWFMLEMLFATYGAIISKQKTMRMLCERNDKSRTWPQHLSYLIAIKEATNCDASLVLDNIAKYASETLRAELMGRYNPARQDYMIHAQELVRFAQELETEFYSSSGKRAGMVNAVTDDTRCYNCQGLGHLARTCENERAERPKKNFTLLFQARGLKLITSQGFGDQRNQGFQCGRASGMYAGIRDASSARARGSRDNRIEPGARRRQGRAWGLEESARRKHIAVELRLKRSCEVGKSVGRSGGMHVTPV